MQKQSLKELNIKNKKLLMRVDFNVPLNEQQEISDDSRIHATLPSIQYALANGSSLILMSHLGRPKGEFNPKLSLAPIALRLSELLKQPVKMAPDCVGSEVAVMANALKSGEVLLLENLRFHTGEEHPDKDPNFAQQLSQLGDLYVNDAFGTAHRKHSSTYALAQLFNENSAAGFLLEKEIEFLGNALITPQKPFFAVIGGAKVSSKLAILHTLLEKVNGLFIGGGMAFTFLKAKGIEIGDSLFEESALNEAKKIIITCEKKGIELLLPSDIVIADTFSNDANRYTVESTNGIKKGFRGLDVGPKSIEKAVAMMKNAKTILWNGPLGVFELSNFAKGTLCMAKALASSPATTIVGGGDSIAAIKTTGLENAFSHLSTGGGAALEFIEKGNLPGVDVLSNKSNIPAAS